MIRFKMHASPGQTYAKGAGNIIQFFRSKPLMALRYDRNRDRSTTRVPVVFQTVGSLLLGYLQFLADLFVQVLVRLMHDKEIDLVDIYLE